MLALVEKSVILKGSNFVKENYDKKIVRLILPDGGKGIWECVQIDR